MDQTDRLGNSHTYITIKHILVDLVSAPLFGDDDDTSSDDRLSFPFLSVFSATLLIRDPMQSGSNPCMHA
jgi:hypothetical protein